MPDVSIAISAKDNFTQAVQKMRGMVTPFRKDLDLLSKELATLNKNKVTLKVDMQRAKRELAEAKKAFQATGDEAARLRLETAQANYDNVQSNLKLVSDAARQAEKDIRALASTSSRANNQNPGGGPGGNRGNQGGGNGGDGGGDNGNGGGGNGNGGNPGPSFLSAMARAGLGQMLGQSVAGLSRQMLQSAVGQPIAGAISTTLSGALTGAAMGSVAGPAGAAVGGLVGLAAGGIGALTQHSGEKDDAFRAYVQQQTQARLDAQAETLSSGSAIAAGRETSLISFSTLFGDRSVAEGYLKDLTQMANTTPFLYDDLAAMSKVLKTFGFGVEEMLPTLTKIGDAGAALGMGTADMNTIATALGRMRATDKGSLEYFNMLTERGINATGFLADAFGVDQKTLYDMISKGEVSGRQASEILLNAMADSFTGSMSQQSQTFSGLSSTLEGLTQEMSNAMGEGFNNVRKEGIAAQNDFLGGQSGESMQQAYRLMGEFQASVKNKGEEIERDFLNAVMGNGSLPEGYGQVVQARVAEMSRLYSQYAQQAAKGDEKAGYLQGQVLSQAKAFALSEYNASEGMQVILESEKSLASRIRADAGLKDDYWNAGKAMADQFSKGLADAIRQNRDTVRAAAAETAVMLESVQAQAKRKTEAAQQNARIEQGFLTIRNGLPAVDPARYKPKAFGLPRVPRDDYPARLHEGERVLTANQARQADAAGGNVVVTGNAFQVREEADITRIAAELCRQMTAARAAAAP